MIARHLSVGLQNPYGGELFSEPELIHIIMSDFRETFEMEFDVYLLTPTMVRFGLVIHTSLKGSITCSITFSIFIFFCSNFKAKFGALFLCYFFKRLKLLYRNLFLNTTTIDRSWILDHFKWYSVFTF